MQFAYRTPPTTLLIRRLPLLIEANLPGRLTQFQRHVQHPTQSTTVRLKGRLCQLYLLNYRTIASWEERPDGPSCFLEAHPNWGCSTDGQARAHLLDL